MYPSVFRRNKLLLKKYLFVKHKSSCFRQESYSNGDVQQHLLSLFFFNVLAEECLALIAQFNRVSSTYSQTILDLNLHAHFQSVLNAHSNANFQNIFKT
jgi:hypothetical protein